MIVATNTIQTLSSLANLTMDSDWLVAVRILQEIVLVT